MAVKAVPDGYRTVTPYLSVDGANDAIAFYVKAFAATEILRLPGPDGKLGHAEIQIGDSRVMLADEFPQMNFRGPRSVGGSPVHLHLYVQDVDAFYARALAAGAKTLRPIADQFYGDRSVSVEDPFGHVWHLATHKEDLTPEEIARRMPKP
jgi:PhnB protein